MCQNYLVGLLVVVCLIIQAYSQTLLAQLFAFSYTCHQNYHDQKGFANQRKTASHGCFKSARSFEASPEGGLVQSARGEASNAAAQFGKFRLSASSSAPLSAH